MYKEYSISCKEIKENILFKHKLARKIRLCLFHSVRDFDSKHCFNSVNIYHSCKVMSEYMNIHFLKLLSRRKHILKVIQVYLLKETLVKRIFFFLNKQVVIMLQIC